MCIPLRYLKWLIPVFIKYLSIIFLLTDLVMAHLWCAWRTSTRRSQAGSWSMRHSWGNQVSWLIIMLSIWSEHRLQREAGDHPSHHSTLLGKRILRLCYLVSAVQLICEFMRCEIDVQNIISLKTFIWVIISVNNIYANGHQCSVLKLYDLSCSNSRHFSTFNLLHFPLVWNDRMDLMNSTFSSKRIGMVRAMFCFCYMLKTLVEAGWCTD